MSEIKLTSQTLALFVIGTIIIGGGAGYLFSGLRSDNQDSNTFTLVAYISGYVGEGGDIDGVVNPTLDVTPGAAVTIILKAGETTYHDFTIDELGIKTDYVGLDHSEYVEELTITFTAPAGEYIYYCSISGHRSTMNGKLVAGQADVPDAAKEVDVADIRKNPFEAGTPIGTRNTPTTLNFTIVAQEVIAEIEPGTTFTYWTYNSTVPGPIIRGMVGDTIIVNLYNHESSSQNHSIDLHAVTGTGGGAAVLAAAPGHYSDPLTFTASHEGTFIYHCATPHIPTHISKGMFGAVIIEPVGGLDPVDVELFLGQNEVYTKYPMGTPGHNVFDDVSQKEENPNYVLFNGKAFGYFGEANAINVTKDSTVRIFFAVGGPNLISSFHMIGEIWDKVWYETNYVSGTPMLDAETVLVAPGSVLMIELVMEVTGYYHIVDHALSRVFDKGAGFTVHVT